MEKRFNSSGIEVKIAIPSKGFVGGYTCPTCGYKPISLGHCLRCGQPIVYDKQQLENYVEHFKNIDEEVEFFDEQRRSIESEEHIQTGSRLFGSEYKKSLRQKRKELMEDKRQR